MISAVEAGATAGQVRIGVVVFVVLLALIIGGIAWRARVASTRPPADVRALAERGYLRIDPVPGTRRDWTLVPLRPADSGLKPRLREWHAAIFVAGWAPVLCSQVEPPLDAWSAGVDGDVVPWDYS